jgi:hypothetical protein
VLWDPIAAEKGGHKHFMLKEIFEQPTAARDTILGRVSLDSGRIFLENLNVEDAALRTLEKVTIIACGTSWHAALVGKYLIESLAQLPVEVAVGALQILDDLARRDERPLRRHRDDPRRPRPGVQAIHLTVEAPGGEQRRGQHRLQRPVLVDVNQNPAHRHRSAPRRDTLMRPIIADPRAPMLLSA